MTASVPTLHPFEDPNGRHRCGRCGEEKPTTLEHFYRRYNRACWSSYCVPCNLAYQAEYREAKAEALRQRRKRQTVERQIARAVDLLEGHGYTVTAPGHRLTTTEHPK